MPKPMSLCTTVGKKDTAMAFNRGYNIAISSYDKWVDEADIETITMAYQLSGKQKAILIRKLLKGETE